MGTTEVEIISIACYLLKVTGLPHCRLGQTHYATYANKATDVQHSRRDKHLNDGNKTAFQVYHELLILRESVLFVWPVKRGVEQRSSLFLGVFLIVSSVCMTWSNRISNSISLMTSVHTTSPMSWNSTFVSYPNASSPASYHLCFSGSTNNYPPSQQHWIHRQIPCTVPLNIAYWFYNMLSFFCRMNIVLCCTYFCHSWTMLPSIRKAIRWARWT